MGILARMIKPFFVLFLVIVIIFQGRSKTYLVQTSDDERKMSQDYDHYEKSDPGKSRFLDGEYSGKTYETIMNIGSALDCACQAKKKSILQFFILQRPTEPCHERLLSERKPYLKRKLD